MPLGLLKMPVSDPFSWRDGVRVSLYLFLIGLGIYWIVRNRKAKEAPAHLIGVVVSDPNALRTRILVAIVLLAGLLIIYQLFVRN